MRQIARERVVLACAAALALSACSSDLDRAEEQYEIAAADYLDPYAKCEAAKRAKDVALEARDAERYQSWSMTAYNDCSEAARKTR